MQAQQNRAPKMSAKRKSAQVIPFKKANKKKPDVILDDVFFHKTQLTPGVKLICYGRLDPLSEWEVVEMKSRFTGKTVGEIKTRKVMELRFLSDKIYLRNTKTNDVKIQTFSGMSYSAIWRLKK